MKLAEHIKEHAALGLEEMIKKYVRQGRAGGGASGSLTSRGLTIQGTTDQVTVTPDTQQLLSQDRSWVISLPQAIAITSSPTFVGLVLSALTLGSILFAGIGGVLSQDNATLFWNNTDKRLGIGTNSPQAGLHVVIQSGPQIRVQDSATNAANKNGRYTVGHYTNSEEGLALIAGTSTTSTGVVAIGGGSSLTNAATSVTFYAAADNVTTSGSLYATLSNLLFTFGQNSSNVQISSTVTGTGKLVIRSGGTTSATNALVLEDSAGTMLFTSRSDGAYAFKGGTVGLAQNGYTTFANLSVDRTCDADTVLVTELADIVGTLIEDLKTKGIISA